MRAGCTVGVLGAPWRGSVTPWGAINPWDGSGTLDWHVAADDRWHTPSSEPTIRQSRIDGTPVIDTRLRVPQGDVAQRVYAIADHGGLTVIEVNNDSPLPVAVAFSGCAVMSVRPPAEGVPIQGIDLPAGTVVFPVGHHASITVALAHGAEATTLPAHLPSATQVARGWTMACDRASQLNLPDRDVADAVTAARCELMLAGPPHLHDDPVGMLLAVHQLVRMIGDAESWMPEVAEAVAAVVRLCDGTDVTAERFVALEAAAAIVQLAGDRRALRDLDKVRRRLDVRTRSASAVAWLPEPDSVTGERLVAAVERRLALGGDLLPAGFPTSWLGQNFDVHGVPTIGGSTVSFALRWHGDRPALLWEQGGNDVTLTSCRLAPRWSTKARDGEALWPAQPPIVGQAISPLA